MQLAHRAGLAACAAAQRPEEPQRVLLPIGFERFGGRGPAARRTWCRAGRRGGGTPRAPPSVPARGRWRRSPLGAGRGGPSCRTFRPVRRAPGAWPRTTRSGAALPRRVSPRARRGSPASVARVPPRSRACRLPAAIGFHVAPDGRTSIARAPGWPPSGPPLSAGRRGPPVGRGPGESRAPPRDRPRRAVAAGRRPCRARADLPLGDPVPVVRPPPAPIRRSRTIARPVDCRGSRSTARARSRVVRRRPARAVGSPDPACAGAERRRTSSPDRRRGHRSRLAPTASARVGAPPVAGLPVRGGAADRGLPGRRPASTACAPRSRRADPSDVPARPPRSSRRRPPAWRPCAPAGFGPRRRLRRLWPRAGLGAALAAVLAVAAAGASFGQRGAFSVVRGWSSVQNRRSGPGRRADATKGHPMDAPSYEKSRRRPTLPGGSPQVPSARAVFTSVFGMGTGVSPPQLPPETDFKSEFSRSVAFENSIASTSNKDPKPSAD